MKNLFKLLIIAYCLLPNASNAQFDFIGRKLNPTQPKPILSTPIKSVKGNIPSLDFKFDSIRPLNELKTGNGEIYPWLSPDGNRIYYSEGVKTNSVKIYMAEKKPGQYKFSNPHPLSVNSTDTSTWNYSAWLTNDELNIYFIIYKDTAFLYHAKRDSISQNFSAPVKVKFIGTYIGDIVGPSLTQDLENLYLNNSNYAGINIKISIFNKTAEDVYTYVDTLQIPNNYILGVGTLTSDDLSYFFDMNFGGLDEIYVFKRNSVKENFTKLYYVNNPSINDSNYLFNTMPYFSIPNNILVFDKEDSGYVHKGEVIYLAYNFRELDIKENPELLNYFNIYPNPVDQLSVISYQLSDKTHIILDVYDIIGNKVETLLNQEKPAGKYQIILNTENFKNGIYLIRITDNKTVGYKKFIKM